MNSQALGELASDQKIEKVFQLMATQFPLGRTTVDCGPENSKMKWVNA